MTSKAGVAYSTASAPGVASTNPRPDFLNFRDLSSAAPDVCKQGKVFRTACPVDATKSQIMQLSGLGISTAIDFRASEEIQEFGEPAILQEARLYLYNRQGGGLWGRPSMHVSEGVKMPGKASSEGHSPFDVHRLSLLERARYIRALLPRIPVGTTARSFAVRLWDVQASHDMLLHEINNGGLKMLYEIILQTSMLEIGEVLKVIARSLQEGRSVMFYCKAGKDRTGLVAALLLSVCGATDEQIIADYHLSDEHGMVALGNLAGRRDVQKLDRTVFSRAPREAMEETLAYLRERYGSVSAYLEACGVDRTEQAMLRSLLAPM